LMSNPKHFWSQEVSSQPRTCIRSEGAQIQFPGKFETRVQLHLTTRSPTVQRSDGTVKVGKKWQGSVPSKDSSVGL
jgi:galactose mutarotase-like enzyme